MKKATSKGRGYANLSLQVPHEIKLVLAGAAEKQGMTLSRLLLVAALASVGRSDLIESLRPHGRPAGSKKPAKSWLTTASQRVHLYT
jgi:hypothetical protein